MTQIADDIVARIKATRAVVFDMDGTLVLGDAASGGHRALSGAADLIALRASCFLPRLAGATSG